VGVALVQDAGGHPTTSVDVRTVRPSGPVTVAEAAPVRRPERTTAPSTVTVPSRGVGRRKAKVDVSGR
jgi:hypothetical protein